MLGVVNKVYISSKLSRPQFEFLLKVKVMGLNPGYLLKSTLALVHLIPSWLVVAEMDCTLHVALPKTAH